MVEKSSGKKQPKKMRKITGESPIPNQITAKGIQARGERLRIRFRYGLRAFRKISVFPSHSPKGTPIMTEIENPNNQRNSEANISLKSLPFFNSWSPASKKVEREGKV